MHEIGSGYPREYRQYQIYKSDEALVIAIAIAMSTSRVIAMSKPRAKMETD